MVKRHMMNRLLPLLSILILLSGLNPLQAQPVQVTVNATGEVSLPADLITLHIQITVTESEPADVFRKHKELEQSLTSLIREEQLDPSRLHFQPMTIRSTWNRENQPAYSSSQQVQLQLDDTDRYERLQVYLIENGFDHFSGQFGTTAEQEGQSDALRNAMDRARQKAETIASSLDKTVQGVLSVEHGASPDIWRPTLEAGMMRSDSGSLLEFSQEVVISSSVTVTYILQ